MIYGQLVRLDKETTAEVKAVTVHGAPHQTLLVAVELPGSTTPSKNVR